MITPLVSVVIPTYNHAHFLGRALQSVIDQTYANWEAIVIDNHSTDNTDDILRDFADERIRILKIHNGGVIAVSRNLGIQYSRGEWIAFLDSDDWWESQKLKVCIDQVNDQVDLIYHKLEIIDNSLVNNKPKVRKCRKLKKPAIVDLLVNGNAINNSSVIVRKTVFDEIGKIDESIDMVGAEDYNTWLRISEKTDGFLRVNESLGYYCVHENNYSLKDMSGAIDIACESYICLLSEKQKKRRMSSAEYMKGKVKYLGYEYKVAVIHYIFSFQYGEPEIVFKSLYMILLCYFKIIYNALMSA